MTRSTKIAALALALSLLSAATASAQQQQIRIQPGPGGSNDWNRPSNDWYFGMSVRLDRQWDGRTYLRVASVVPGGPADRAGLERGDSISQVNGQSFRRARGDHDAVAMLQRAMDFRGGVPTGAPTTLVRPDFERRSGVAHMSVVDVRSGRRVPLQVFPRHVGRGGGGAVPTFARNR